MPELTPGAKAGLRYFGAIQGAVDRRASTADIWAAIRGASESFGVETAGIDVKAVNVLRSYAADIRNKTENLTAAPDFHAIDGSHISTAPWARPLEQRDAIGKWQARFEHVTLDDGVISRDYRTVIFSGQLPGDGSVGTLRSEVESDAAELANKYNLEHVGIGDITLMAI